MVKKVYIDTSVVGGYFDNEFEFWTKIFFKSVKKGDFILIISDLLTQELKYAPLYIKTFLNQIPENRKRYIELSEESNKLANLYINNGIVGIKSLSDCRHIASATVNGIDVLISWNFKHIVNLSKIHLYNGINIQNGYKEIEIRTPREILNYEN